MMARQGGEKGESHIRRTASSVVTRWEESSEWLHAGQKALPCHLCLVEREAGGPRVLMAFMLMLCQACISLSLYPFLHCSFLSLANSQRKGEVAEGFARNYATQVEIGKLLFPIEKAE